MFRDVRRFPGRCVLIALLAVLSATSTTAVAEAESEFEKLAQSIDWKRGPYTAALGDNAQLEVPEGYLFVERKDMRKFIEMTHNAPSGKEVGALVTKEWTVFFEFDEVGYIKDDEKDKLDADAILKSIKEGSEAANEYRKERGWSEFHVVGWEQEPFYDQETHNLTWAIRGRGQHGDNINYNSRILGRGGVMEANLVVSPERLQETVPVYKQVLTAFAYKAGQSYAEWKPGDKVAQYGLVALVAGGAGAIAAKAGLFGKLGKFFKVIVIGAIALFAALGKAIKGLFGGRRAAPSSEGWPGDGAQG